LQIDKKLIDSSRYPLAWWSRALMIPLVICMILARKHEVRRRFIIRDIKRRFLVAWLITNYSSSSSVIIWPVIAVGDTYYTALSRGLHIAEKIDIFTRIISIRGITIEKSRESMGAAIDISYWFNPPSVIWVFFVQPKFFHCSRKSKKIQGYFSTSLLLNSILIQMSKPLLT